jgi:hypothetical protein
MREYIVKYGETIGDVCLNACGSILAWPQILDLNNFTDWNPVLTVGSVLQVPEIIEPFYVKELSNYPASNNVNITDLNSKIATFKALLVYTTTNVYTKPTNPVNVVKYTVKQGETISDVVLNATGSILNWSKILDANNFTEWVPTLTKGQQLNIDYDNLQQNVKFALDVYPACNNSDIRDLDTLINDLIVKLTPPTKTFEDGNIFDFEDGLDYKFE